MAKAKANDPTCFVAGTMVHTKDGLVPIEKIKVGDYVLSKPENGEGEQSYKRVTRTFVHENASDIYLVKFTHATVKDGERKIIGGDWIFVTGNHPFYTKNGKWTHAINLGAGREVQLMDGNYATTSCGPVYQTHEPNVGWTSVEEEEQISCGNAAGDLVEFGRDGFVKTSWTSDSLGLPEGLPKLALTVYNIEVEENHTYYVGKLGIWAHNKEGGKRVLSDEAKLVDGSQAGQEFIKLEPVKIDSNTGNATTAMQFEQQTNGYRMMDGQTAAPALEFKTPWVNDAAAFSSWLRTEALSNIIAATSSINLSFADLPGAAVGQTTGTNITPDTNASGYGWFIDSTPWDNSEFLPTSNPTGKKGTDLFSQSGWR